MNASFISYSNHEENLQAIKKEFPTAFFNGPEFGEISRQLITVIDCTGESLRANRVVRKLVTNKRGFVSRG